MGNLGRRAIAPRHALRGLLRDDRGSDARRKGRAEDVSGRAVSVRGLARPARSKSSSSSPPPRIASGHNGVFAPRTWYQPCTAPAPSGHEPAATIKIAPAQRSFPDDDYRFPGPCLRGEHAEATLAQHSELAPARQW